MMFWLFPILLGNTIKNLIVNLCLLLFHSFIYMYKLLYVFLNNRFWSNCLWCLPFIETIKSFYISGRSLTWSIKLYISKALLRYNYFIDTSTIQSMGIIKLKILFYVYYILFDFFLSYEFIKQPQILIYFFKVSILLLVTSFISKFGQKLI